MRKSLLYTTLVILLVLFACSGKSNEKVETYPEVNFIHYSINGLNCRRPVILKMHQGVAICRDAEGRIAEISDAHFVVPWGAVREYYPSGTLKSEAFYESMMAQSLYRKEFYESGVLKYLKDSLGTRSFDGSGKLIEADTSDGKWKYNYRESVDEDRVYERRENIGGDSAFSRTLSKKGVLLADGFRSRENYWNKLFDSTGTLFYYEEVKDSLKTEIDYYSDGKVWVKKEFHKSQLANGRETFDLDLFVEYAESGEALREYEIVKDSLPYAICRFRNEGGDSLTVPERRKKWPYSMKEHCVYDLCKGRPRYDFVDSCAVPKLDP